MALTNYGGRLYIDGHKVEIAVGQTSINYDVSYTFDTKLVGIKVFTDDAKYGDYATFTVRHPTIGEVARFGNNCYIPDTGTASNKGRVAVEVFVQGYDGAEVPAGLTYRLSVNAIDTSGRKIIMWLMLRK